MRLKLAAVLMFAAGGVATVGLLSGKGGTGDVGPAVEAAPVRGVRLPACPDPRVAEAAKCPGGCVRLPEGGVLCLTDQKAGDVDGEVDSVDSLAPAQRRRLVVCPSVDIDHKPSGIRVRWEQDGGAVELGCQVVARPLVTVSIDGIAGNDLVSALAGACIPCSVSGKSWGPCPRCILEPGGCAKACPVVDGGIP